jgi:hypothetical protein
MRLTMGTASVGSVAFSPNSVWLEAAVSRLVPSRWICASRPAPAHRADAQDRDHRGDADGDAERGQRGAQRAGAEPAEGRWTTRSR